MAWSSIRRRRVRGVLQLSLATIVAIAVTWVGAGALAVGFPTLVPGAQVHATPTTSCIDPSMVVVAHEDDDLLFTSPDLVTDIVTGRCVRTVFLTAGDAAQGSAYWAGRESGSQSAYASMAGVPDRWTASSTTVLGQELRTMTLVGEPQISLVFLRLPDGNRSGTGMAVHDHESLMRLWTGEISTIHAVDGSSVFGRAGLEQTLSALITAEAPTTIRTMDWTRPFGTGDNADHTATALLTRNAAVVAAATMRRSIDLLSYEGYPSWTRPPNVAADGLRRKAAAVTAYAPHDPDLCLHPWCVVALAASSRVARQYVVDEMRLPVLGTVPAP